MYRMPTTSEKSESYLFRLEVTVQAPNKDFALERLVRILDMCRFDDYKILSGVPLKDETRVPPIPPAQPEPVTPAQDEPAMPAEPAAASAAGGELEARIQSYIESNRLLRLHVNKGRGVKLDFPCRMLHLDPETRNLTVYHVDEKKVYIIRMNEVDDIIETTP
jgi:hypothetical protein